MPEQKRIRKHRKRIGVYSSDTTLKNIDERTVEGKLISTITQELYTHVGGNPTVAEQLLIQIISLKAMRVSLYAKLLIEGSAQDTEDRFLTLSNSLRNDLNLLGIKATKQEAPALHQYIEGKA